MSERAKFLADLKRKALAQSPCTSEIKRSLPRYSSGVSTVANDERSKRKRSSFPANSAFRDLISPNLNYSPNEKICADGRERRTAVQRSKDGVRRPFEKPMNTLKRAPGEEKEGSDTEALKPIRVANLRSSMPCDRCCVTSASLAHQPERDRATPGTDDINCATSACAPLLSGSDGHKEHVSTEKRPTFNSNLTMKDELTACDGFEMKIKQETDVCCAQSADDDLSFLMSLLPHIRSIPLDRKLRFRNRINEVVDQFAYTNVTRKGT